MNKNIEDIIEEIREWDTFSDESKNVPPELRELIDRLLAERERIVLDNLCATEDYLFEE